MLGRCEEEVLQSRGFEIPVNHDHPKSLEIKPLSYISRSHRPTDAALKGVKSVNHALRPISKNGTDTDDLPCESLFPSAVRIDLLMSNSSPKLTCQRALGVHRRPGS